MKISFVLAIAVVSTFASLGQEPKGAQALMEAQTAQTAKQQAKVPVAKPAPASEILGKPVRYGGFITDAARAANKRALFSLKTPLDPEKDLENISFYPGTDKIQGVIFFSIKY